MGYTELDDGLTVINRFCLPKPDKACSSPFFRSEGLRHFTEIISSTKARDRKLATCISGVTITIE